MGSGLGAWPAFPGRFTFSGWCASSGLAAFATLSPLQLLNNEAELVDHAGSQSAWLASRGAADLVENALELARDARPAALAGRGTWRGLFLVSAGRLAGSALAGGRRRLPGWSSLRADELVHNALELVDDALQLPCQALQPLEQANGQPTFGPRAARFAVAALFRLSAAALLAVLPFLAASLGTGFLFPGRALSSRHAHHPSLSIEQPRAHCMNHPTSVRRRNAAAPLATSHHLPFGQVTGR